MRAHGTRRLIWLLAPLAVIGALGVHSSARQAAADETDPTVTVVAVGDLACDPDDPKFNDGRGVIRRCNEGAVSELVEDNFVTVPIIALGDYQYDCDDPDDFQKSYDPTWGQVDDEMVAVVAGNHEYRTGRDAFGDPCPSSNSTAAGFFEHFGAVSHPETSGHFSEDIGDWHIIGLNGNCNQAGVGGCTASSAQTAWLKADLAATTQPCILAAWHQPLYQGLAKDYVKQYKPFWDALLAAHADVVLNGHVHDYQRYAPMDSSGHESADGITEYVVGTGGESEVAMKSTGIKPQFWQALFGYLEMDLGPSGWHSAFVSTNGHTYDDYDGVCH